MLVNACGGSCNADKTGNGGGTPDYGQVTFSGSAFYDSNIVRGFSQGAAVYAGSVVQQDTVSFSGNSEADPTVLNLRSTDSSRPGSFSGNFRWCSVGSSTGGVPNSITVMGHVSLVMHADPDCLISMEDSLYSFAGYSSTFSLRKMGDGTPGFGNGASQGILRKGKVQRRR